MRLTILNVVLLLGGCASSASVTLIDRTDGQEYVGKTGPTAGGDGDISALIEGSDYQGHWSYSASGGGYSLATGTAFSGAHSSFGSAIGVGVSAQGNGLITMRDDKGQFMRCVFDFNTMSNHGIGECRRNDGREYDLRVKR